jgi:hypothetical protein
MVTKRRQTQFRIISLFGLVALLAGLACSPNLEALFGGSPGESPGDDPGSPTSDQEASVAPATPSPTQDLTDPRAGLNLSNPDYTDDFSDQGRWYSGYEDAGVRLAYEGQAFAATDKLTDLFIFYSGSGRTDSNFYAEIDMTIGPCSGRDSGGMAVRVGGADNDRSYVFEVACNGQYRLRKFIDFNTIPQVLRNWTTSAAINLGSNATNRLGLFADGDELYLFVNGELLTQAPIVDNGYAQGRYGIFASAAETPFLKVLFDNFAVWVLAP